MKSMSYTKPQALVNLHAAITVQVYNKQLIHQILKRSGSTEGT